MILYKLWCLPSNTSIWREASSLRSILWPEISKQIRQIMSCSQPPLSLTFLLVGKTGDGKSSTGNSILGRQDVFKESDMSVSETTKTQVQTATVDEYNVTVVDTPGVMHTGLDLEAIKLKACRDMQEAISKCPSDGKMAVILVFKYGNRFTEENKIMLDVLKQMYGEENLCKSCVILITYGDNYRKTYQGGLPFEDWIREQNEEKKELGQLFQLVQNRCILFNNRCKDLKEQTMQRRKLIDIVNELDQGYTKTQFLKLSKQHHRFILDTQFPRIDREYKQKIQKLFDSFFSILSSPRNPDRFEDLLQKSGNYLKKLNEKDDPQEIFYDDGEPLVFHELREQLNTLESMIVREKHVDEIDKELDQLIENLEHNIVMNSFDDLASFESKLKDIRSNPDCSNNNHKIEIVNKKILMAKQAMTKHSLESQVSQLKKNVGTTNFKDLFRNYDPFFKSLKDLRDTIDDENQRLGEMDDLLQDVEDLTTRAECQKQDRNKKLFWGVTMVAMTGISFAVAFIPIVGPPLALVCSTTTTFGKAVDIWMTRRQRFKDLAMSNINHFTFLLVGKTGSGISSTANSLLKECVFKTSDKSKTKSSHVRIKKNVTIDGMNLTVVDTPGLMHTGLSSNEAKLKACNDLQEAVSKCPDQGKLVIIIVLKYGDRFTEENRTMIQILKQIFGEDNFGQSFILVVTFGDLYDLNYPDGHKFDVWLKAQTNDLGHLLSLVQYRCVKFNNICKKGKKLKIQRQKLFELASSLDYSYSKEQFQLLRKQQHRLMLEAKLSEKQAYYNLKKVEFCTKLYIIFLTTRNLNSYELLNREIGQILKEIEESDNADTILYREGESRLFAGFQTSLEAIQRNVKREQTLVRHENEIDELTGDLNKMIEENRFDKLSRCSERFNGLLRDDISNKDLHHVTSKLKEAQLKLKEAKRDKLNLEFGAKIYTLQEDFGKINLPVSSRTFTSLRNRLDEIEQTLTTTCSDDVEGLEDLLNDVNDLKLQMNEFEEQNTKFLPKDNCSSTTWLIIAVIIVSVSIIPTLVTDNSWVVFVVAVSLTLLLIKFLYSWLSQFIAKVLALRDLGVNIW
ncbi:GIMAP protein [Biomphalaria glabrata]